MARYETYAAWAVIVETGNDEHFRGRDPRETAKFLRHQFRTGDEFIQGDPILSRLNRKRIEYLALACCLCDGGSAADLDAFSVLCR